MSNNLNAYNPIFYAQTALINLYNALGMANAVYREYDSSPGQLGDTIKIRRPSTFTAQSAPSTAQDVKTSEISVVADQWQEVKFALTDKELSIGGERLINEHISQAAAALAQKIDDDLTNLYKDVPTFTGTAGTTPATVAALVAPRTALFNQKVPLTAGSIFGMVDGAAEGEMLGLQAFSQYQGAGETGVSTQVNGIIGRKYGIDWFANQNVKTHTKGTANTGTTAVNGAAAVGDTTINLDAGTLTGTLVPGDTFVIAGNSQRYAVTNTVTASGNAMAGVTFTPALVAAAADNAVVAVTLQNGVRNLVFHKNAFALAIKPLTDLPSQLGARVFTATDPITRLSIRARLFYNGDTSTVSCALDVLYGKKTLDPNLAVVMLG